MTTKDKFEIAAEAEIGTLLGSTYESLKIEAFVWWRAGARRSLGRVIVADVCSVGIAWMLIRANAGGDGSPLIPMVIIAGLSLLVGTACSIEKAFASEPSFACVREYLEWRVRNLEESVLGARGSLTWQLEEVESSLRCKKFEHGELSGTSNLQSRAKALLTAEIDGLTLAKKHLEASRDSVKHGLEALRRHIATMVQDREAAYLLATSGTSAESSVNSVVEAGAEAKASTETVAAVEAAFEGYARAASADAEEQVLEAERQYAAEAEVGLLHS